MNIDGELPDLGSVDPNAIDDFIAPTKGVAEQQALYKQ